MTQRLAASDGYSVRGLTHAANDPLFSSLVLFDQKHPQTLDSAGYLAQLGIELLLKAALLNAVGSFPKQHRLALLRTELANANVELKLTTASDEMFVRLDAFYDLRYPDPLDAFYDLRYPDPAGASPIGNLDRLAIDALIREILEALPAVKLAMEAIDHERKAGRVLFSQKDPDSPAAFYEGESVKPSSSDEAGGD